MAKLMKAFALIARGAALLLLIAAAGYALDRWALKPLRCAHAASLGTASLGLAQRTDLQTRRVAAQVQASLQDCDCVTDATIPMTLGAAAETIDDPHTAITEYQRALLLDRRPEIYFHLGLMQQQTPDRAAGLENIVRACAFDPSRLADIPYEELRQQTKQRLQATYGHDWFVP
jgi:hypothetical protein